MVSFANASVTIDRAHERMLEPLSWREYLSLLLMCDCMPTDYSFARDTSVKALPLPSYSSNPLSRIALR